MATTYHDAVRQACLWLPDTEEFISHGSPNFRPRGGRIFATYVANHHGDGRIALWLNAPSGVAAQRVAAEPKHFFIPPYVGPYGWVGVHLDRGLSWDRIVALVRESYEMKSPAKLVARIGRAPKVTAPTSAPAPGELDRMQAPRAQAVLAAVRQIVGGWPEVHEDSQFGYPVFRAGKRVFVQAYDYDGLTLAFWVGVDRQGLMTMDPRYHVPRYSGHNGWIGLDVRRMLDRDEVHALALDSYRHFALKRMLVALERDPLPVPKTKSSPPKPRATPLKRDSTKTRR